MPTMKPTTPNAKPSDITSPTLESLLEAWSHMHPASELTFYRLNRTPASPHVCKITYHMGKGALVLQATSDTYYDAFLEVGDRVNRTVGRPVTPLSPSLREASLNWRRG